MSSPDTPHNPHRPTSNWAYEITKALMKECAQSGTPRAQSASETKALNFIQSGANVNHRGFEEKTPLMIAACVKRPVFLKMLLDHGADINAQDAHGDTALHNAVFAGQVGNVKCLLSHGIDLFLENKKGMTALSLAEKQGRDDIAKIIQKDRMYLKHLHAHFMRASAPSQKNITTVKKAQFKKRP